MDKYRVTDDVRGVFAAIRAGLRCEATLASTGEWAPYHLIVDKKGVLRWQDCSLLSINEDRKFRIEVPKPDDEEGYRILEPDEELNYRTDEELNYRTDEEYMNGAWTSGYTPIGYSGQCTDRWYRRKVEAPKEWTPTKPKMRRVELHRSIDGLLVYKIGAWGIKHHVLAQGEKGFCGYEYEGYMYHFVYPSLFAGRSDKARWDHAAPEQVERGERAPIYPVAFWVWEGE